MFDIVIFILTLWKFLHSQTSGRGNLLYMFMRDGKYFSTQLSDCATNRFVVA